MRDVKRRKSVRSTLFVAPSRLLKTSSEAASTNKNHNQLTLLSGVSGYEATVILRIQRLKIKIIKIDMP
jgi:hypothetical protein